MSPSQSAAPADWGSASPVRAGNLLLRFLLEVSAVTSLAIWGATIPDSTAASIGLGVAAPLVAATVWGLFVSPKAKIMVPAPLRIAIELGVFVAGVAALVASGHPVAALVLGGAVATHQLLNLVLGRP